MLFQIRTRRSIEYVGLVTTLHTALLTFFFMYRSIEKQPWIGMFESNDQIIRINQEANVFEVEPKIPRHLVFTYKHNILKMGEPKQFYDNIHNIAQQYKKGWAAADAADASSNNKIGVTDDDKTDVDVTIHFLDDQACISNITAVCPGLVPHFSSESSGAFKADICRLAFLYLYGGYYFDVDVDVLEPFIPESNVHFVTVNDDKTRYFFQAILMTSPRHPIIKQALDLELEHYERGLSPPVNEKLIGCDILKRAHDFILSSKLKLRGTNETIKLLDEINLSHNAEHEDMYRHIQRRSWLCNSVVHDPITQHLYFKSRIAGSSNCPKL